MVTHMKTTLEIADGLLTQAKREARRRGIPLRRLVEEGLRQVLKNEKPKKPFKLKDGSVGGGWLRPELEGASWEQIRDIIYEGHGA
jgi:hypothetical protein